MKDFYSAFAEHGDQLRHDARMGALFDLWKATGDPARLEEAGRMMDHLLENAPADCRESMVENVRFHREILEARASHIE